MKRNKLVTLILALVLVCSMSAMMLVGCGGDKDKDNPNPPAAQKASTYVALDINPSVELILDENNKVMSVRGLNEDAQVLLYGEDGIIGADVNVAAEKIGKLSTELKFVNGDNNTVNITIGGSTAAGNDLSANISASLNKGAGVELNVQVGANFSLQREIDALKAQYKDNAEIQKIDVAKYRVMMEAMAADATLTIENAVKMEMDDLLDIVEDARDAAIDMLPKAQKVALEAAEDAYEAIVERLETGVYMKASKVGILDKAFADHVRYIAYKNIDITLEQIESLIEVAHADIKEEVKKADVDAIFNTLVENEILTQEKADEKKAEIVDAEGKADLDKIEAYLDIVLKNAKSDAVELVEEKLDDLLDAVEEEIEALEEDIPETIREDIKKLIDDVKIEINNELKDMGIDVDKFETIVNGIIDKVLDIDPMTISYETLEKTSDLVEAILEGGEYEYYNALTKKDEEVEITEEESLEYKVKASMTKEQLAEADQMKADLKNGNTKIAEAKKAYDEAVTKACADAEAYLKAQKDARKTA